MAIRDMKAGTRLGFGVAVFLLGTFLGSSAVRASDLPVAAGSPISGIAFEDRPLLLPVQRNFQMAMLTASSELGRSCGHMEAYGWRMDPNEQGRVNQIFNNTVDRLRAQGFVVESQTLGSVSHDVTLFTADRRDKNLIFMWSAGEVGLVMVLCQTSAPLPPRGQAVTVVPPTPAPELQTFPENVNALRNRGASEKTTRAGKPVFENFSPLGEWAGTYTCLQGTTGGTLQITKLRGEQVEGQFRFYPTPKNPYVPSGRYSVSGTYDRDSQRILINPGAWIEHPKGYQTTIMIGSFDPAEATFSGYFQGINGCTSFEAKRRVPGRAEATAERPHKAGATKTKAAHKASSRAADKKSATKAGKNKAAEAPPPPVEKPPLALAPAPESAPAPAPSVPDPTTAPGGIVLDAPTAPAAPPKP